MNAKQALRVEEAREALRELGFDAERCNERSALVLLALLGLTPTAPWPTAADGRWRTVEMMEFLREHYARDYKPNTRETLRRQTLHQFVDAGLVLRNPDDPERAVNSPKTCYQVAPSALQVLRIRGTLAWSAALADYLTRLPGQLHEYASEREMRMVPVKLPDGTEVTLTPGGQNILIKLIVEEFCPRFTPGGQVLYIGDAGKDDPVFDAPALAALGAVLDKHGKLPDLIVHQKDRDWLVLIEAASSHGPVDAKRHAELAQLFVEAQPGLVYISCFPSRAEMRKYLSQIAWETDVWCAEDPTHLIHFNGDRFLGPYEAQKPL